MGRTWYALLQIPYSYMNNRRTDDSDTCKLYILCIHDRKAKGMYILCRKDILWNKQFTLYRSFYPSHSSIYLIDCSFNLNNSLNLTLSFHFRFLFTLSFLLLQIYNSKNNIRDKKDIVLDEIQFEINLNGNPISYITSNTTDKGCCSALPVPGCICGFDCFAYWSDEESII